MKLNSVQLRRIIFETVKSLNEVEMNPDLQPYFDLQVQIQATLDILRDGLSAFSEGGLQSSPSWGGSENEKQKYAAASADIDKVWIVNDPVIGIDGEMVKELTGQGKLVKKGYVGSDFGGQGGKLHKAYAAAWFGSEIDKEGSKAGKKSDLDGVINTLDKIVKAREPQLAKMFKTTEPDIKKELDVESEKMAKSLQSTSSSTASVLGDESQSTSSDKVASNESYSGRNITKIKINDLRKIIQEVLKNR